MILEDRARVPDGWRMVACRHTWVDFAELVSRIAVVVEGEEVEVTIGHELSRAMVQTETLVVAPAEQQLGEVAHYVAEAWRDTMGKLQRNTCPYAGVYAYSGNGDDRLRGESIVTPSVPIIRPDEGTAVALTLLVTLQTNSRPRRITGRIHVPGVKANYVDMGSGWVTASGIVTINDALFQFDQAVEDSGYVPVVGNPRLQPNYAWPVIGMTVRRQLQPQRRRKYDSLSSARTRVEQFI